MKKKIAWIFITGVIIFAWIAVAITPTPTYPIHIVSDTIVEATREAVIDGNVFENFTVEWIVDTIYPLPDPTIIDTFKVEWTITGNYTCCVYMVPLRPKYFITEGDTVIITKLR